MYLARRLRATFDAACQGFPAVLVTGPRQSGKTTFLRHALPADAGYVTFDDPLEVAHARDDPHGFLDRFAGRPLALDEIQYVPELLPYIKMRIDADRQTCGRFLLTGSQQFSLMQGVTESLAGRVAVLELLPMSEYELGQTDASLADALWLGGYPEPRLKPMIRDLWMRSYLRTYLERDVRQVRDIRDLRAFEQFLGLVAARHGQEFEKASLARACGVSQPTIAQWLSVLAASYVVFLLSPWHRNLGKRLIKRPKLYFLDPALVSTLTRQPSAAAAWSGPLRGALMEGLVVAETVKLFASSGQPAACWYWRDRSGLEVDLLIEVAGRVVPVEIKATATPTVGHTGPLRKLRELIGDNCAPGLLVCNVAKARIMPGGVTALPWRQWPAWLSEQLTAGTATVE